MAESNLLTWHEAKREEVFIKRGIDFADLEPFFGDEKAFVRHDNRHDYKEERFNMLSCYADVVLNITYTPRAGKYHIISARMANRKERILYAQAQTNT